jgi:cytochrome P450
MMPSMSDAKTESTPKQAVADPSASDALLASLYRSARAAADGPDLVWNAQVRCWFALDPELAQSILRSDAFAMRQHHLVIADLAGRKDVNLDAAADVLAASPLSHDGAAHQELRRDFARLILRNTDAALRAYQALLMELLSERFTHSGSLDLVADFVRPLAKRLFATLIEVQEDCFSDTLASNGCFSQMLSTSVGTFSRQRLKATNHRVEEVCTQINGEGREKHIKASIILGVYQGFIGAFANALLCIIARGQGQSLQSLPFPETLPTSAIPFADRICRTDVVIGHTRVKAGDIVLAYLGSFDTLPEVPAPLLFGTGAHACIGRPLAERCWTLLAAALRRQTAAVAVADVAYRDLDYTLVTPVRASVRVTA